MPELPEVETTVRAVSKFQNKILKEIIVHNANLRWKVDKNISQLSKNKLIKEITRRAKYILIHFNDSSLMIHLGMSGKLRIQSIGNNFFKKHDHIELIFDKEKIGQALDYGGGETSLEESTTRNAILATEPGALSRTSFDEALGVGEENDFSSSKFSDSVLSSLV